MIKPFTRFHSFAGSLPALIVALAVITSPAAYGHGSVVDQGDACVIQFGFYSAHFAVFQPQTRGHREFCEDIPDATDSIFVMEYLHNSMREVPLEFRIMYNNSGLGRFVRWTDIEAMADVEADTVFHQMLPPQPDGVVRVMHSFDAPGDYIGIVSIPHPTEDILYHAVFPFRVGLSPLRYWPLLLPLLTLIAIVMRKRRRQHHLLSSTANRLSKSPSNSTSNSTSARSPT